MAEKPEIESSGENGPESSPKDSFLLLSYLDEVDDRVEDLRRRAQDLLQERESLLMVLSQIREDSLTESVPIDESHDLQATIERLRKRCEAVEVKVNTIRSPEQEQALSKVESLVQDLERICILGQVDNDENSFSKRALCLLNACTSDAPFEGPIDYKFQGMVLGCKLEDQKMVRHRLECLVNGRCHEDFVEAHIGQTMAGAASVSQLEQEMQQCSTSSCNVTPSH